MFRRLLPLTLGLALLSATGCATTPRDTAYMDHTACLDQAAAEQGYRWSPDRQHVYSATGAGFTGGHFVIDFTPGYQSCMRAKGY